MYRKFFGDEIPISTGADVQGGWGIPNEKRRLYPSARNNKSMVNIFYNKK